MKLYGSVNDPHDLVHKKYVDEAIASARVQPDLAQADSTAVDFIKNKDAIASDESFINALLSNETFISELIDKLSSNSDFINKIIAAMPAAEEANF